MACGDRKWTRFHNVIHFYLADLDLDPSALQSAHTKAWSARISRKSQLKSPDRDIDQSAS